MNTSRLAAWAAPWLLAAPLAVPLSAHAVPVCVDFLALPDNAALAENFVRAGFNFRDRAGGFGPFVNVFVDLIGQNVHGMQFDKRGLRIRLPIAASRVDTDVGAFKGTGITIEAYDAAGILQGGGAIFNDSIMHATSLFAGATPIAELRLRGGGYEGVVNSVCATP